ncbi:MAG: DUF2007 domain-containing protein [Gemmataceae bacterium]
MHEQESRTVVVGSFGSAVEANLARNLLEREGIACILDDADAKNIFGLARLNISIHLAVQGKDAPRATALLAEAEMNATLEDDWETLAEHTAVCTLCDEPLLGEQTVCANCATPREGIRTSRQR